MVGAGNRAQDQAIVKPMSSALMNRMLHVELQTDLRGNGWTWAYAQGIHEWVIRYVETRPDHLFIPPPKTEETFTTPRSWHILSDALLAYGKEIAPEDIAILAEGCLSPQHARSFAAFIRQLDGKLRVDLILKGEQPLPRAAEDRDVLYFIAQSIRAQLAKELPPERDDMQAAAPRPCHAGQAHIKRTCAKSTRKWRLCLWRKNAAKRPGTCPRGSSWKWPAICRALRKRNFSRIRPAARSIRID